VFNVYTTHGKGSQIKLPPMRDLDDVRGFAEAAVRCGQNVLIRAFEITDQGEQWRISYSVLNGEIRELDSPVIPRNHWDV